jgi:hypothetical protein
MIALTKSGAAATARRSKRSDILGIDLQDFAIQRGSRFVIPLLLLLACQSELSANRVKLERLLEGIVGFLTTPEQCQTTAQIKMRQFERRIQPGRILQYFYGFFRPPLVEEEMAEVLMRFGEGRGQLYRSSQPVFGLAKLPLLDQDRPEQCGHAHIVRVLFDGLPTNQLCFVGSAEIYQVNCFA